MTPSHYLALLRKQWCTSESVIAGNKKGVLIHTGREGKLVLFTNIDPEFVDAYIEYYSSCTELVPRIHPWYVGRDKICLQAVEGPTAADEIIYSLVSRNMEKAVSIVRLIGTALRRLHEDLLRCNRSMPPSPLGRVVTERCNLAIQASVPGYRDLIRHVCSQLIESIKRSLQCGSRAGHGDLHLYQVIMGDKVYFLDPGREPDTETYTCIEYDVVSLARSIEYAAEMSLVFEGESGLVRQLLVNELLSSYRLKGVEPDVLDALYTARTIYEYYYEVTRSTGMEWIPIKALREIRDNGYSLIRRVMGFD